MESACEHNFGFYTSPIVCREGAGFDVDTLQSARSYAKKRIIAWGKPVEIKCFICGETVETVEKA